MIGTNVLGHDLPLPPCWPLFNVLRGDFGGLISCLIANPACHLYDEFSTSCTGGEEQSSKVTCETSLCDSDNRDDVNRQLWTASLN